MDELKPGVYRHFKGRYYRVHAVARHSETEEPMVVYQKLYDDRGWWVRPLSMWSELVTRNGVTCPRFTYVGESEADIPENER